MIVTIDGPAGVGKSSVAKMLADELGFRFLDTGAMYRAVTLSVLCQKVDPGNEEAVAKVADNIDLQFQDERVLVNGIDVTQEIRLDEVTAAVSPIADNAMVRERLVEIQREIASDGNYICEGRDQGTVVFPNAICKIFLVASAEERAARRVGQFKEQGIEADYETILQQQNDRDRRDYNRPVGRLLKADDAIEVITDHNTLDEVAILLAKVIREKIANAQLAESSQT